VKISRTIEKRMLVQGIFFCLTTLIVLAVCASTVHAGAKLKVEPLYYDFGEIPEGPSASMTAVLENTGDAGLAIKNVRTNCACTTSELGKQTLKPQEKTTLRIVYSTVDRPGLFRKNITIETDIKGQEEVEFEIGGTVKEAPGAKIQVTPRKLEAGSMKKGALKKLTLSVNNSGALPLIIKKIFEKGGGAIYFDGTKQGDIVIEAGKTRQLEIDYKPEKSGQFTEVVLVDSNAKNAPKAGFAFMITGKSEE
jgi:hypothetical protein